MSKDNFCKILSLGLVLLLTQCTTASQPSEPVVQSAPPPSPTMLSEVKVNQGLIWSRNPETTWNILQQYSSRQLKAMQAQTENPTERAWIKLVALNKQYSNQPELLYPALESWKKENPNHPAKQLLPERNLVINKAAPKQIALLLPQHGVYGPAGQSVKEGFLNAYYANKNNHPAQNIRFYDTSGGNDVSVLYQKAVADGADMVIGPLIKEHVAQLGQEQTLSQPTIALNYSEKTVSHQFYQFGLLPEDEAMALAMRAHLNGVKNAMIIAPNNNWGKRLVRAFTQKWQALSGTINNTWYYSYPPKFENELHQQLGMVDNVGKPQNPLPPLKFDSVFLFTQAEVAKQIIPLLQTNIPKEIPLYANSAVSDFFLHNKNTNPTTVCELPKILQNNKNSDEKSQNERLYAVGQDAYLISENLDRLASLPRFPIYGSTGALTLTQKNQIHRSVPCHVINQSS